MLFSMGDLWRVRWKETSQQIWGWQWTRHSYYSLLGLGFNLTKSKQRILRNGFCFCFDFEMEWNEEYGVFIVQIRALRSRGWSNLNILLTSSSFLFPSFLWSYNNAIQTFLICIYHPSSPTQKEKSLLLNNHSGFQNQWCHNLSRRENFYIIKSSQYSCFIITVGCWFKNLRPSWILTTP